jgi:hypothetical protein
MADSCPHMHRLPYCDQCASVPRMSRWASGLSGYQLADALETLDREPRYYQPAERKAVLIEAARRLRP